MRKRYIIGGSVALVTVAAIVGSAASGGGHTTAKPPAAKVATKAPTKPDNGKLPLTDGDWTLKSVNTSDGFGDFMGTARIQYNGSDPSGGSNMFSVTLFKHGKQVGNLTGAANNVNAGDTVTVDLISTDPYKAGPYTYDFAGDL